MRSRRSAAKQRGWWWVGPAISAVAGAIAGDKQRKAANRANDRAVELANDSLQRRAADARAAGLHPLAALGAGGAVVPTMQVGDYGWVKDIGQDVSRAVGAYKDNEARGEQMRQVAESKEWAREQQRMAREAHEMEMQLQRARLFRLQTEPGTAPAFPSPVRSGEVDVRPLPPVNAPVGLAKKSEPGFQRYYAGDEAYDLPNSELAEVLEGMGAAGHVIGPLMMLEHRKARDMRERLAQYEKDRKYLGPPKAGHYWKYDPEVRGWRELPKYTHK